MFWKIDKYIWENRNGIEPPTKLLILTYIVNIRRKNFTKKSYKKTFWFV
jgi:hypothetical protein